MSDTPRDHHEAILDLCRDGWWALGRGGDELSYVRVTEGARTKTRAELIVDGVDIDARLEKKLDVTDSEVSATVFLGMIETGFGLAVELDVHIPNLDDEEAWAVTEAAHQACPYSNATRGNIDVKLAVV